MKNISKGFNKNKYITYNLTSCPHDKLNLSKKGKLINAAFFVLNQWNTPSIRYP